MQHVSGAGEFYVAIIRTVTIPGLPELGTAVTSLDSAD